MAAKNKPSENVLGNLSESVASYVSAKLGLPVDDVLKVVITNQVEQTKILKSVEKNIIKVAIATSESGVTKTSVAKEESATSSITPTAAPTKVVGEKSELAKEDKPQTILIGGYTQEGLKDLQEHLPEILEESFEGIEKKLGAANKGGGGGEDKGSFLSSILKTGLGMIAGGGLAIIGGLAALVKGIMDDGPFKGLMKVLSRIGIEGGIELVKRGAEKVVNVVKGFITFFPEKFNLLKEVFENIATKFAKPFELLKGVGTRITGIFDKIKGFGADLVEKLAGHAGDVFKALPKGGFLEKIGGMLSGLFSKVFKFAKKLPFGIGTAIGLGFAISRMLKGDFVGGLIDVASAIATLVPGVGTALSFGIDAIGMFLDIKAGEGTGGEKSAKKGSMILDFLKPLGIKLMNGLKLLPIIGPAVKAIEHFKDGQWGKGLKQLAYILPPIEIIGSMLGDEEASPVSKGAGKGLSWILGKLFNALVVGLKKVPVIGPLIKSLTAFDKGDVIEGIKQLAYMFPPLEMIGGLLGDRKADSAAGLAGQGAGWLIEKVTDFLTWALPKTPVFGPLIKAVQSFMDGKILKGFKHLAYMLPPFEFIGGLLGDTETSSFVGNIGRGAGSLFKDITEWAFAKLSNKPVFGPLIRALGEFASKNWLQGLKFLAYMVPAFEFVGGLLGDKDTVSIAGSVGEKTGNFFGKIKNWIVENLSNKPIIGPLIHALTAFKQKDWLGGLKFLAYMVPAFEFIGGLFGDTQTVSGAGAAGAGAKNIIGSIYEWFKNNIENLPFIGNLIKAGRAFGKNQWLKGLKLIAYAFPPLEFIGGMFGDKDASGLVGQAGAGTVNVLAGIKDWVVNNAESIPVVGQLIKAVKAFKKKDWKEGFAQLGRMVNPVSWIIDLFSGGEEGSSIGEKALNFVKDISNWVKEKIYDVPILGDIARGLELLATDPIGALKAMGRRIPVIRGIIKFFESEEPTEGADDITPPKSPFEKLKESLIEKAREWWKNTYKWVRWLAEKILPADIIKQLNEDKPAAEDKVLAKTGSESSAGSEGTSAAPSKTNEEPVTPKTLISALKEQGFKSWQEIPKEMQDETIAAWPRGGALKQASDSSFKKLVRMQVDRELQGRSVTPSSNEAESFKQEAQQSATAAPPAPVEEKKGFWGSLFSSKKEETPAISPAVPAPVQEAVAKKFTKEEADKELAELVKGGLNEQGWNKMSSKDQKKFIDAYKKSDSPTSERIAEERIKHKLENPQLLEPNTNANITPAAAVAPPTDITPAPAAKESSVIDTIKNAASNVFSSSGPTAVKIEGSMENLLGAIANNTGGATQNLKGLIGGFNALAKALEEKLGVPMPSVAPASGPSISEYANQGNPDISNFRSTMETARPRGF
jgi:hypothetical protein